MTTRKFQINYSGSNYRTFFFLDFGADFILLQEGRRNLWGGFEEYKTQIEQTGEYSVQSAELTNLHKSSLNAIFLRYTNKEIENSNIPFLRFIYIDIILRLKKQCVHN